MKGETYRLSDLIGMTVRDQDGHDVGVVADLRAERPTESWQGARVRGFAVTPHHTGAMLGYDRGANPGPAIVRRVVQHLHRNAVFAPWESVVGLDWSARILTVDRARLAPLRSV